MAMHNLAVGYFADKKYSQARQILLDALNVRPDFRDARLLFTQWCVRFGLIDQAQANLQRLQSPTQQTGISADVQSLAKTIGQLKAGLANAKHFEGAHNCEKAIQVYNVLLEHADLAVELLRARSHCRQQLKQYNEAIDDLKRVLSIQPAQTDDMFIISRLYLLMGQTESAMRYLRECLRVDADNSQCKPVYRQLKPAMKSLEALSDLLKEGSLQACVSKAESSLQAVLKSQQYLPEAVQALFLAYQCRCSLEELSDQQAVVDVCSRAIDLSHTDDPDVYETRARAYSKLFDWDRAKADYELLKQKGYGDRAQEGFRHIEQLQKDGGHDYYDLLGVPRDADNKQIDKAFRRKAKQHHPDRLKTSEEREKGTKMMELLSKAKDVLKDPEKRRRYDNKMDPDAPGYEAGGTGQFFDQFSSFFQHAEHNGNGFTFRHFHF